MTNFDLYKLLNFIVSKDVYAKAMSEPAFDLELKAKNMRHFRNRLGVPESYTQDRTGAGSTRLNELDLVPFLMEEEITIDSDSVAVLPTGWYYPNDFWTSTSRSSDIMSYQELSSRFNNALTAPTTKDLAAYIVKEGLRIYPAGVEKVTVNYYRKPVDPVFAVTVNTTTHDMEYDTKSSVELEWDDGSKLDIMHMILVDFGLNTTRQDVSQYADKLVQTGK